MAITTNQKKAARIATFIATIGLSAVLVGAGVNATGAYFSDSKSGAITGTIGSIKVTGGGGNGANGLDFQFTNLLPGETQTVAGTYQNTGRNNQDVYIVFDSTNGTLQGDGSTTGTYLSGAVHALNNLGRYGEVHLGANGSEIFGSANLNDNLTPATGTCGAFSTAGCWPLLSQYKLAGNVAPNEAGTFSFGFKYGLAGSNQAGLGNGFNIDGTTGPGWNSYPLDTPSLSGLPYQIVATQVGVAPGV
jgi:hypothetical protein